MSRAESALVIGVDIGGSKILAGLVGRDGSIARTLSTPTPATPAAILSEVRALCQRLLEDAPLEVIAIGVGSAGTIDSEKALVVYANENLPGWTGTRLSELSIDGLPVYAENDARALSYGEAMVGAGAQHASILCVTVGTGIGGGIIINGEVLHGANYSAGEIGYLVVGWEGDTPLILDQYLSGPGIERAYQAASDMIRRLPLTEISRRAAAGDQLATAVIETKAREFGHIMGGLLASLDPDALVIGGGVPQIGPLWWHAFESGLRRTVSPPLWNTPVLPATHGVEAVMLGAALLAWHKINA